jgi:hypothetical protein
MRRKIWVLLILAGAAIGVGGFLLLNQKVLVLQLENTDRARVLRLRVNPGEHFSIYYIHSVYGEPVIEEFEAGANTIVLKGMRTKSGAITEQYGFDDLKTFHPMDEKLGAIFLRVAPGEGQGIILRERKIYLGEIGERGDRVQLGVRSISRVSYLLTSLF